MFFLFELELERLPLLPPEFEELEEEVSFNLVLSVAYRPEAFEPLGLSLK